MLRPGRHLRNPSPEGPARQTCVCALGVGVRVYRPLPEVGQDLREAQWENARETPSPADCAQVGVRAEVLTYSAVGFPPSLSGLCCS